MPPFRTVALLLALLWSVPVSARPLIDADGCVDKEGFEKDWRRYSDFDERIPRESRSWETQQHQAALDEIREAEIEIARLQILMELDREHRLAARDYRKALQQGHKVNLLKTFWRMTWITYNTIGGPTGRREFVDAGKDFAELLLKPRADLPTIGRALGVAKELLPKEHSSAPGEAGKVINIGVDARLESLKYVGGPPEKMVANVVAKVMETAGKEYLPSSDLSKAELSDEELNILRHEHIELRHLDKALEQNYALNKERAAQIDTLKAQIKKAQQTAEDAEWRERRRVFARLDKDCLHKPLKITISAPAKVRLGESAPLSATATGGSGKYRFTWYAGKPGTGGRDVDLGSAATIEDRRSLRYQPGAVGPHIILLNVQDLGLKQLNAQAGVIIEAVASNTAPVASPKPPAPAPAPASAPGGLVLLETLTVDGNTKGMNTSFSTQHGTTYVVTLSGEMRVEYYGYNDKLKKDTLTLSTTEGPSINNVQVNGRGFNFLNNYTPMSFHQKVVAGNGKPLTFRYGYATFKNIKKSGSFTVKVYEVGRPRK